MNTGGERTQANLLGICNQTRVRFLPKILGRLCLYLYIPAHQMNLETAGSTCIQYQILFHISGICYCMQQFYLPPTEIWNLFAQSWIFPFPSFPTHYFIYKSLSPVLNPPSGQRAKRAKIKQGWNFPCIQYFPSILMAIYMHILKLAGYLYTGNSLHSNS